MSKSFPVSATNFYINTLALLIFGALFYNIFIYASFDLNIPSLLGIFAVSITPIIAYEYFISKQIKLKFHNKFSWKRTATKLCGLYLTLSLVVFIYWLLPIYKTVFFTDVVATFINVFPIIAILAIPYFAITDRLQEKPKDSYWHAGNIFLRQEKPDYRMFFEHSKAWIVKVFFFSFIGTIF